MHALAERVLSQVRGFEVAGAAMRPPFRTRAEVERYFGRNKIECLLCGKRFGRLSFHLAAKHGVTTDGYKEQFGLPWSRGLVSAVSHVNSGWTEKRRREQRKRARQVKLNEHWNIRSRRQPPPFVKLEVRERLRPNHAGFGADFESAVRALFERGLFDREIAKRLKVNVWTVNQRTKHWRKKER